MASWQTHRDPAHVEHVGHELPAHLAHLHGTRIVQISDLHVGPFFRAETFAAHIARIHALKPDLVVITGDAMDWARRYESDYVEPLRVLEARYGVLAILGNHDFYFGARRLANVYRERSHVRLLRGDCFQTAGLPGLYVWGIDDPMSRLTQPARYPNIDALASKLDPRGYHVLLSHRPDAFPFAARAGFQLQLSGHTHGGQVSFRSILGRIHISRLMGPFDRGMFELNGPRAASHMYVNRGLGYTALPYRRDCHTEITLHELVARPSKDC